MNCAYLHLAGGCCAHNVVVVQLKSQNVITIQIFWKSSQHVDEKDEIMDWLDVINIDQMYI